MENKNIIIFLIVIIVILAAAVGVMFFQQMTKEKSNLKIPDKTINVGNSLIVSLSDSQGNPITNETIKIKLTNKDGITIDEKIKTNSKGKAKFKMEEKGKYSVECTFDGNNQYSSSSVSGNVSVKKATTELVNEKQTSTTTHSSKYAPDGGIYPEYGPEVDNQGITREYAIANDMHYVEITVDGDRPGEYVTVGGYTARDPNNGKYHT
ncbi:type IV pilin [uncultured Methanobrevibacter sp.]|uniref:type IV pilin n=1 Tax=uncultured Methanobrevibacter sp. TaxID=253161 RepID=UPI0025D46080|nr:type IV pilin [uncultured Methanobrevibacter sp.]